MLSVLCNTIQGRQEEKQHLTSKKTTLFYTIFSTHTKNNLLYTNYFSTQFSFRNPVTSLTFKFGLLQHFYFSNEDIMEWINRLASLFYVFSNAIWNQFIDHLFQVVGLHLSGHDLHHLLADLAHLLVLGVRGLPNLIVALFSKTHTEQTKQVTISSLDVNMSFNHGLVKKMTLSVIPV